MPSPSVNRDGAPPSSGTIQMSLRVGFVRRLDDRGVVRDPDAAREDPNSGVVSTLSSVPSGVRSSSVHAPRDSVVHRNADASGSHIGAPSTAPAERLPAPPTLIHASSCSSSERLLRERCDHGEVGLLARQHHDRQRRLCDRRPAHTREVRILREVPRDPLRLAARDRDQAEIDDRVRRPRARILERDRWLLGMPRIGDIDGLDLLADRCAGTAAAWNPATTKILDDDRAPPALRTRRSRIRNRPDASSAASPHRSFRSPTDRRRARTRSACHRATDADRSTRPADRSSCGCPSHDRAR